MKKRYIIVAAAFALWLSLSAFSCAGSTHQSAQAAATDSSPAGVSQMASGFRNLDYKCVKVGGMWFAVFTTSDGGSNNNIPSGVAAVPDPQCKQFGP